MPWVAESMKYIRLPSGLHAMPFDTVERRGMWREVKRHCPGDEPPGRVALRVVHPVAGDVPLDRRGNLEALPGVRGHGDTVAYRKHKPATAPGNDRAHLLAD